MQSKNNGRMSNELIISCRIGLEKEHLWACQAPMIFIPILLHIEHYDT